MPLVSGRFRLCSALPYQILESHLQALPWLLFAFLAGPFRFASSPFRSLLCRFKSWPSYAIPHPVRALRLAPPPCLSAALRFRSVLFHGGSHRIYAIPFLFGSLRLRWPRFQFCSFRLLSQLLLISAMPLLANRFSAAPLRFISCLGGTNPLPFDASQIRADHLRCKSGLRTSNPCQFSAACADQCRACSLPFRSIRHSAVSSLLFVHPVEASQIHCFSAQSTSPRSLLHLAYPSRFISMPSSRLPSVSVRRHSTRGLSFSLRGDSGLRTSLAWPFSSNPYPLPLILVLHASVPRSSVAMHIKSDLRSAVSTLCLSGLFHAVTTLRIFGIRRSLRPSSRLPSWPSLPSLQPQPSGPPRCGCRR